MKSYLRQVWMWCGLSVLVLLGLRYLPEFTLWGHALRPVNLLSEVSSMSSTDRQDPLEDRQIDIDSLWAMAGITDALPESSAESVSDTLPIANEKATTKEVARPADVIPIEDYGIDQPEMGRFYQSLQNLPHEDHSVHIAVFGDSFIEGDLITDHLRDTLQSVFGGRGVGFVPIASPLNSSRTTITERFEGFSYFSAVATEDTGKKFAISGQLAVPTAEKNQVTYHGVRQHNGQKWFQELTLFYQKLHDGKFSYSTEDGAVQEVLLQGGQGLRQFSTTLDSATRVRLTFPKDSSLLLHGVNFAAGKGLYVDNFSLRGTLGHALFRTPRDLFRQSDSLLRYRLVVVQYGLNVLSHGQTDYSYYATTLRQLIERIRAGFPESSILIVGVGDRSERLDGEYRTMRGLYNLLDLQRRVAREQGVAFWDLHTAMGGEGSMVRFVNHSPPLANKDFTHINRRGGNIIAGQLAKALLFGYGRAH